MIDHTHNWEIIDKITHILLNLTRAWKLWLFSIALERLIWIKVYQRPTPNHNLLTELRPASRTLKLLHSKILAGFLIKPQNLPPIKSLRWNQRPSWIKYSIAVIKKVRYLTRDYNFKMRITSQLKFNRNIINMEEDIIKSLKCCEFHSIWKILQLD